MEDNLSNEFCQTLDNISKYVDYSLIWDKAIKNIDYKTIDKKILKKVKNFLKEKELYEIEEWSAVGRYGYAIFFTQEIERENKSTITKTYQFNLNSSLVIEYAEYSKNYSD